MRHWLFGAGRGPDRSRWATSRDPAGDLHPVVGIDDRAEQLARLAQPAHQLASVELAATPAASASRVERANTASAPATGSGPGVAGGPERAEQVVEPKIALRRRTRPGR